MIKKKLPAIENILTCRGIVKIFVILTLNNKNQSYISGIAKNSGISTTSIKIHLEKLVHYGIIEEISYGRTRVFRLKTEENKVNILKKTIKI